ncbi:hypothetical protein [Acrocarpospora sp. B8E8]|uniref:hypothetical protein n=1 Tax=Acrocarpospora sp. B8E8 TaxID=3153572 RepID=UPI00325EFEFC
MAETPTDPPYGVIPDDAIAAAARVIAFHVEHGQLTAYPMAEAVLHAAHPHLQPLMPVVDPDAFDAYVVTSTCDVWLTCPRDGCEAPEVHESEPRPADQVLTLGDLTDLALDHEGEKHGGYRPSSCEIVDTPTGPISVQAEQPIPPALADALGDLAGVVRANHAGRPDPYGIAREALAAYSTEDGGLRLNATRAASRVVTALRKAGLVDPPMPPQEDHPPIQTPANPDGGPDAPEIDDALQRLIRAGRVIAVPAHVRIRHGNRNPQNIYQVGEDGTETFVAVAMSPGIAENLVDVVNNGLAYRDRAFAAEEAVIQLSEQAARAITTQETP